MKKDDIEHYYRPNEKKEKNIWTDCIFIFDTSALLEFYYFPKKFQEDIFNSTFERIKERLWIPHHVKYEYLKNRENTLQKPIEEKYKRLEDEQIKVIESEIKNIKNRINNFINHTKKEDTHPYIDNTISLNFEEASKTFETAFSDFKSKVAIEFKKREEEINAFATEDFVLESFSNYFKIGREYNFEKLMEIVEEGEIRYRNKIPPGYKDGPNKEGMQKYGDLIVWKQIIDFAEQSGKPIVFITNDVKEDWCYHYKRSNEVRIIRPKEDLITEIRNKASVDFCMYTFSQFLHTAKEILGTNIPQEIIDEAKTVSGSKKTSQVRFDGYYRTLEDSYDPKDSDGDITEYEYYYQFYEDGKVDFKMGTEKASTTGIYTLNGNSIKIEINYPSPEKHLVLIGTINADFIQLEWSSDAGVEVGDDNNTGSERGLFYSH
ncbi:PIN-like domain-containing protein [Bacillus sp. ES1-5]|uniref:PIN-like domain-containing protein n=1 Tax=Bacillus sp. ES1-5 TaxID=1502999 RepID=UPI001F0C3888|nr:PIN-like domain-containing protein [Bacillus sp. ES1-5]